MTQYIQTQDEGTSNAASAKFTRSDLVADQQTMPPFAACDALDGAVTRLDEWVSSFIGRIQPYCHQETLLAEILQGEQVAPSDRSPLERRIYETTERVALIMRALDEMNQHLRL